MSLIRPYKYINCEICNLAPHSGLGYCFRCSTKLPGGAWSAERPLVVPLIGVRPNQSPVIQSPSTRGLPAEAQHDTNTSTTSPHTAYLLRRGDAYDCAHCGNGVWCCQRDTDHGVTLPRRYLTFSVSNNVFCMECRDRVVCSCLSGRAHTKA